MGLSKVISNSLIIILAIIGLNCSFAQGEQLAYVLFNIVQENEYNKDAAGNYKSIDIVVAKQSRDKSRLVPIKISGIQHYQPKMIQLESGVYEFLSLAFADGTQVAMNQEAPIYFRVDNNKINYAGDWLLEVTEIKPKMKSVNSDNQLSKKWEVNKYVASNPSIPEYIKHYFSRLTKSRKIQYAIVK